MLHADAVRVLSAWDAPDPDQDLLRRDYLRHLRHHPDGLWRSCLDAHLTASVLVAAHDGRRVLLTLHRRIGRWLQLGGHCERGDASLATAARREAVEESGIEDLVLLPDPVHLDRHLVRCRPGGPSVHLDVQYVATAAPDALERASAESLELRWFPTDALPPDADDALRRLVASAGLLGRRRHR